MVGIWAVGTEINGVEVAVGVAVAVLVGVRVHEAATWVSLVAVFVKFLSWVCVDLAYEVAI